MPRFNVENPKTGEWRCFSTIVDDWITDWMDEERYEQWRKLEYGRHCSPVRKSNQMSLDQAEKIIKDRQFCERE